MHYVWQHRLWLPGDLRTAGGECIEVLDPGLPNTNAGPDFFNAKIRVGERVWAGNVEIHVRASDWKRHGHDNDRAYDTVILHVVGSDDCTVCRPDGSVIPQTVMRCAPDLRQTYDKIVGSPADVVPCAPMIADLPRIYVSDWMTALGMERLYAKAARVDQYMKRYKGDWKQTVYTLLARGLGFGVNGEPFERLAAAMPLRHLLHHCGSPLTIEAALFGQAGLLDVDVTDQLEADYLTRLRNEYAFVCGKYNLKPPGPLGWKMARMRPANFPHRRIALLGALVNGGFSLCYELMSVEGTAAIASLFDARLPEFWHDHFSFNAKAAGRVPSLLSTSTLNILLINVAVPLLYAWGLLTGRADALERAVDMLHSLPAERNNIISRFAAAGISCDNAFASQALIELQRNYCEARKCLYCRLGHRLLSAGALLRPGQGIQLGVKTCNN